MKTKKAYHCQLMETLMALKADVVQDLLCVIAHGTLKARVPGAHLLFYYWPSLNPTLYDRRGVNVKFSGEFSVHLNPEKKICQFIILLQNKKKRIS